MERPVMQRVRNMNLQALIWSWAILIGTGAFWGLSFSLARIATTRGVHPLGIVFWECFIGALLLIFLLVCRRIPMPMSGRLTCFHLLTGLVGMVVPGAAFFYAAAHLPAGVLSISNGITPILTFVASALLGLEKFMLGRIFGVILGALAVVLLVAPASSLPDPTQLPWVFLSLISASCYTFLNLILAFRAPSGVTSLVLTCGMFVASSLLMIPVLYVTGAFTPFGWPWGIVEWAIVGLATINAVAYPLYFMLVDHAGPVFGSFSANVVTLFGVFWGIVIFSEHNSIWVWLSLATIMSALALVAPRRRELKFE
jgi:drug/metabolite transporter (DMT)-like permease